MEHIANIDNLVNEYQELIKESLNSSSEFQKSLVDKAEWSPQGAQNLLDIVHNYGSFFLRNALALSIVLGKEDGDLNF